MGDITEEGGIIPSGSGRSEIAEGSLMNIKEALRTIGELERNGVVERYAIGGAIGASIYLQPLATLDIDVFVTLQPEPGQLMVSLRPIYDYLTKRNATVEGEHIVIAGWPVQFLSPAGALGEEAVAEAVERMVDGVPIRVITAEHLAAMALKTGRAKDKTRLLHFKEAGTLDSERFMSIIERHDLLESWQQFERQYLQP